MDVLLVLCTFPNAEVAQSTATALVGEGLAACVNLAPQVTSIYRWEGKVESANEVLGYIKTTRSAYEALEGRLRQLHPYEVPEILAFPVERGSEAYLAWVKESVTAAPTHSGESSR